MTRYLDDSVTLSNKACPRYYSERADDGSMKPSKRCTCPEDRCWYDEQKTRRMTGKKAIDPIDWPEEKP